MATYEIEVPTLYYTLKGEVDVFITQLITLPNGMVVPQSHIEDASRLESEAYVHLYEIHLAGAMGIIYLKPDNTVTWQGKTYEGTSVKLTGVGQFADEESSRPTLVMFNPDNVFSSLVDQGYLEGSDVVRIRILRNHLEADLPIFSKQKWKLSRVASVRGSLITCEIRDITDGHNFVTPARQYIPPEFPAVSL